MMLPWPRRMLCAALLGGTTLPARTQPAALQFGVMPNVSARILLAQYQPFRMFLERELSRPVEIVTAPSLRIFHERSLAGAYGLVVVAANLGRVASLDGGLRPVAIYEPRIPGVLVAHRDRAVADIAQVLGRNVAMSNPQSLVALTFTHWLRAQGHEIGRDIPAVHARNEDSLAQMLTGADTPLAVMSRGEFNAIRPDIRDTLVVWQEFAQVPGFLVLLGPAVQDAEARRLTDCLAMFHATDEGREFFTATGFRSIRRITPDDLAELDPMVPETRRLLTNS